MLTKTDFIQLEKRFATKADLKELQVHMEKRFVTKDEFHNALQKLTDQIIDLLNAFRKEWKEEITEFRTEFLELRTEIRDITESHERRIEHLEDKAYS